MTKANLILKCLEEYKAHSARLKDIDKLVKSALELSKCTELEYNNIKPTKMRIRKRVSKDISDLELSNEKLSEELNELKNTVELNKFTSENKPKFKIGDKINSILIIDISVKKIGYFDITPYKIDYTKTHYYLYECYYKKEKYNYSELDLIKIKKEAKTSEKKK